MNLISKHFAGGFGYIQLKHLDASLPPALRALCPRAGNFQPGIVKIGGLAGYPAARRRLFAAVSSH